MTTNLEEKTSSCEVETKEFYLVRYYDNTFKVPKDEMSKLWNKEEYWPEIIKNAKQIGLRGIYSTNCVMYSCGSCNYVTHPILAPIIGDDDTRACGCKYNGSKDVKLLDGFSRVCIAQEASVEEFAKKGLLDKYKIPNISKKENIRLFFKRFGSKIAEWNRR